MKLYYAPGTVSIAVAIALEEVGLSYIPRRVDFASAEQTRDAYRRLNPKGRVPALVLAGERVLTETGAILEYIAAKSPEAGLLPDDPETAAHMRAVMYYLASTMHVAHAHRMRGSRWADQQSSFDDMTAKVPQTMRACAEYVEENAFLGDFVAGEELTIADPYLFIVCNWLSGDGVAIDDLPRLSAFMDRMNDRESVRIVRGKDML
jgi:glutathione S-transferase